MLKKLLQPNQVIIKLSFGIKVASAHCQNSFLTVFCGRQAYKLVGYCLLCLVKPGIDIHSPLAIN